MRLWITVLCLTTFGILARGQTNQPVASSASAITAAVSAAPSDVAEPTSTTTPDNTRYQKNPDLLKPCQARLDAFNNKPCDLIFIGGSITEGWATVGKAIWDAKYAPHRALNFGVEGDKIQNVLWRLNNMDVGSLKPKVAVVMVGTYNIENTPHEIADGIKAILQTVQADFAGVKIILVSILPNESAQEKMAQVNSIIKSYDDGSTVYFLNLVPLMPEMTTPAAGGVTITTYKGMEVSQNQLRPDATGYQIWSDAMEPLLTKLMGQ